MHDLTFSLDDLGNTSHAVFAVGARHTILTWNHGAELLFRRPASSVVGHSCHEVIRARLPSGKRFCAADCPLVRRWCRDAPIRDLDLIAEDGGGCHLLLTFCTIKLSTSAPCVVHFVRAAGRHARDVDIAELTAPSLAGITRREADVLRALASGATLPQIAARLCVSPLTVRTHIRNLLRKKDLHNQRQLVIFALRSGLVPRQTASTSPPSF
jgi:DNA-binding CsgD family transcriptional regulator